MMRGLEKHLKKLKHWMLDKLGGAIANGNFHLLCDTEGTFRIHSVRDEEIKTVEVGTSRRDASAVHQDFSKDSSSKRQRYKKRSRTKSDGAESLSNIDDSEIVGYLNNKKEMHLKRMLWKTMNKEHVTVKKQKPATETKKTTSARKAVKTIEKLEQEQCSGVAHNIDLKLDSCRNDYSQN
ncbi:uncharacterized protein LOC111394615 isoform X2 [Olea europaea var. sylvestris]|uniref:uncharacterized protein LOC111394615 isoform X2 n=1 Tax=Olea europaea var. sylvestris TaxID=158386 RepID=UPI000C1D2C24|nr:uncharacterized protein LOC111394615 isoform X2 [Olea europaea var. sylvestris]